MGVLYRVHALDPLVLHLICKVALCRSMNEIQNIDHYVVNSEVSLADEMVACVCIHIPPSYAHKVSLHTCHQGIAHLSNILFGANLAF